VAVGAATDTKRPTLGPVTRVHGRTFSPYGSVTIDGAVIAGLFTADVVGIAVQTTRDRIEHPGQVVALGAVAAACAAAFWWRRRRPFLLLAFVVVAWIVAARVHDPALLTQRSGMQLVLVVYAFASWSERRGVATGLPAAAAVLAAFGTASDGKPLVAVISIPVALFGAPWFAGYAARMRRQHLADVEQRLARAETEVDERARLAVVEERARIARDLHDVVAHHVSLIGVQAGAARMILGHDAPGAGTALAGIESSSRDALREMRHLLDALGSDDGPTLAPAPGLPEFTRLCETFRRAGLDVRRSTNGPLDHLAPLHALTLYRIAEEALTNVARHSAATTCTLRLSADAHEGRVTITDPGPCHPRAPVPPPGAGRGLIGIRQRVELFGGTLHAGAVEDGTYVVDATIALTPR